MDNSNNFSNSLLQSSEASSLFSAPTSTTNESFFDKIKNISLTTWLVIILILALLGINIFSYLAKGTQTFSETFKKIIGFFRELTGQTINVAAEGGKKVIGVAAETADTALDVVQDVVTPSSAESSVPNENVSNTIPEADIMKANALNRALNTSRQAQQETTNDYGADDSLSSIQGKSKSGWCYIGEDRGFRSCVEVGKNDNCMSGEIFPTHDVCVNPKLRP
jgi:hypothetical protein